MKPRFLVEKIILVVLCLGMAGCLMTRDQLRGGGSGGYSSPSRDSSNISAEQKARAERAAREEEKEDQIRTLTGRVEELQNQLNEMVQKVSNQDVQNKVQQDVNQKFQVFEEALRNLEAQIQQLGAQIQSLTLAQRKSVPTKSSTSGNKGNFRGAQDAFSGKQWKKAIVGYQKYRELNPKGKWYSEATYKIGVCFQELKMAGEAKPFYEEVIAKYPKSKYAKKAKYRLKKL